MKGFYCFMIFISIAFIACEQKDNNPSQDQEENYFSVRQFFEDQWETRKGNPYTLIRISNLNDLRDTNYVGLNDTLWKALIKPFNDADISDSKFYGHYTFNYYEDEDMDNINLHYEAKEPELFLRKMIISADYFTQKVKSVYLETLDKKRVYEKRQKLFYVPDKILQIQEYEKSVASPEKNIKIEYHFQY